jgi:uncharacterized membrane protein
LEAEFSVFSLKLQGIIMKTLEVAVTAICAAVYAVVGYLTSFGFTFGGVAFWPAAFIPAVFAILFGPWVGGTGAAIGIFIRDISYTHDPFLSIVAGVTANFAAFFLIGYLSRSELNMKKIVIGLAIGSVTILAGLLLPTLLLPSESSSFTLFSASETFILFASLMAVSLALFGVIWKYWREFRMFGVAAVIGQGIGATIVSIGVWGYSQLFFAPNGYFKSPIPATFVPFVFVWTFATEIPFVLLLAPPIAKACYLAFPFLRTYRKTKEKGDN